MLRKQVAATGRTPLPDALRGLLVTADVINPLCDLHSFRRPQRKCVYWTGRPLATGVTVTIAHSNGLTGHGEFDRTTKAFARVHVRIAHDGLPPKVALHHPFQVQPQSSRPARDCQPVDGWASPFRCRNGN